MANNIYVQAYEGAVVASSYAEILLNQAIREHDKKPVQDWAIRQTENGATWLDINTGAAAENQMEAMPEYLMP